MGSEAEGGRGAVSAALGARGEDPAAGDLGAGAQAEPRGEVFFGRPAGHIEADLGDESEGDGSIDALDTGEVHAGDAEEGGAGVEGGGIAVSAPLATGGREGAALGAIGGGGEGGC